MTIILVGAMPWAALAGCGRHADLELSQKFQAAQDTFEAASGPEDFLKAAAFYQEILDRGAVCGAVLYNQGNAFMQAGQRGRAIAAYRRALRFRPTDPYLEANLRYALSAAGPATPRRPWIEHLLFWQNWVSYPMKFYLAAFATATTFVLGVLALLVHRRLFARLAIGCLVVTGLLVFSAAYDWYRYDYLEHGVVVADQVVALKGSNASIYEPAFSEPLHEGTEFRLIARRDNWLLIRLAGNQEGWIQNHAAVVY